MNHRTLPLLSIVFALLAGSAAADDNRQWPGAEWTEATPESQNVDAALLNKLDQEFASGKHGNIDGMSVYRNGFLVYSKTYKIDYDRQFADQRETRGQYNYHDADWHPWYDHGDLHTIQSISKSVTSALVGIALRRGEILAVETKAMPYFKDYKLAKADPRRDAITLRDLLTMTAGIDWDESSTEYTDPMNSAAAMEASDEWVQFVLDQPMRAAPGDEFEYNSGITVLLSHILLQATGKHADEYAIEHLFGPLNISNFYWKKTPTGLVDTEGGLYLRPDDLAKIGYLYMNDGMWNGKRILPQGWVKASMQPSTDVPDWDGKYGYQWWLLPYEGAAGDWVYTGLGYGGQWLFVVPEYDLVAMFTAWNIDDRPGLNSQSALRRLLDAVH